MNTAHQVPNGSNWLSGEQPEAAALLAYSEEEQKQLGYFHTLKEILQQPLTWVDTATRMIADSRLIEQKLAGAASVVLTGSGSSQYAGECVRLVLQRELQIPTDAIDGGALLTYGSAILPPLRPCVVVSLARSGDSPESVGALSQLLDSEPGIRHLVLTCNRDGALADPDLHDERVHSVVLDERTNDRSLVMTSSFSNLVLAARFLGLTRRPEVYRTIAARLSALCVDMLSLHFGALADAGRGDFRRAIFLASGPRVGAAREAGLKMLEMTAGRVAAIAESYLGLRHGPMSYVHGDTLIVCFLSCDPVLRSYEADLIRELNRKDLGMMKILVGEKVAPSLAGPRDVVIQIPGLSDVGDDNAALLDVVVGQLLAFARCRHEGLKPDSPSEDGVINRVVESFQVYQRG